MAKTKPILFISLFLLNSISFGQSAPMGTTFTNSTATACWGTSSTASQCLTKTFTVSGVGILSSTNVLNSISINMGGTGCQTDISTYDISLIAPGSAATLNFITNITLNTGSNWINTTFVDNSALERIRSYSNATQSNYNPWSIGYYAPDVLGSFASTFNGINADGIWTIQICEQSSGTSSCNACGSGSNLSYNSSSITFGNAVPTYDASVNNLNDCAQAQCIDNTALVTASNNGYANGDALYPGEPVGSCGWNGANNNSAWFRFTPTGSTAQIVLSGIQTAQNTQSDTQPIVLENTGGNGCPTLPSGWIVPTGGCPDNAAINNMAYLTSNGGGISTASNVYSSGITANAEFNLSGLTPNKTYYVLVDGNGGAASTFMIQMNTTGAGGGANGAVSCNLPLPVEFLNFETTLENQKTSIYWSTASERNNLKFVVEKSRDYINWIEIEEVKGAFNSSTEQAYHTYDFNPYNGVNYYRIKQVDVDGKYSYSFIRTVNTEKGLLIVPNPNNGQFNLYGLDKNVDNEIVIYNLFGQKITEIKTNKTQEEINISEFENGVYYMIINHSKTLKFTKN